MKTLGIIIARGGSKELPKKNILKLGNKTLIEHAIKSALNSKKLNKVILSTDDDEIINIAKKTKVGIPFKRPKKLARDDSSVYDVLKHAVNWLNKNQNYNPDIVVLLQCSVPFRTSLLIDKVIDKIIKTKAEAVLTITKPDYPPYWMLNINSYSNVSKLIKGKNYLRRQQVPQSYQPSGSVYAFKSKFLMNIKGMLPQGKTKAIIISREESINIDTPLQYELAKLLYKNKNK